MRFTILALALFAAIQSTYGQVTVSDSSVSASATTESPKEKKKFDPSKLVFGGNLGVSFGDFTFVNISPQVGYRFSPIFTAGAGINYIHNSFKTRYSNNTEIRENYSYAGLNLFGRIFPNNFLFAMAQPEINYSWGKIKFENSNQPDIKQEGKWIPTFLVGAGVTMGGRGGRGGIMLSIQYDLVQDPRSPYGTNPFVGMGFSF